MFFGRANKRPNRSAVDIEGNRQGDIEGHNLMVLKDELNWTAHEAEVANLRSEILLRRMLHLEEDISKIKESIKTALEVAVQINGRLERLETRLNADKGRKQAVSSLNHIREVAVLNDLSKLSYVERQVLDLLSASGPMSAREIKEKIGRSREHVSRLLGKLVDRGLLVRNKTGRQVIYDAHRLSIKGGEGKLESSPPQITTTVNENDLKDDEGVYAHP